jgi:hypothetical protein
MTFDEVLHWTRARLGQGVIVSREENGRIVQTKRGDLAPGVLNATDVIPGERGQVGFRVAPLAYWFVLWPEFVADAHEEREGKQLRIDLYGGSAIVIEIVRESHGTASTDPWVV